MNQSACLRAEEATDGHRELLAALEAEYPGVIVSVPTCVKAFGCVFSEILTDDKQVYVKVDDDIIFIKDGSIEHLAYQVLFNEDYAYYTGAVVNNPHGFAVHRFVGAYPPETFHWAGDMGTMQPPFYNHSQAAAW